METTITDESLEKAQSVYSKGFLKIYDLFVFTISCRILWRCSKENLIRNYDDFITENHLYVGVGSGYLIDNCNLKSDKARIGLMDLNKNCLDATEKRLQRHNIEKYRHNVFDVFTNKIERFDSIAISNLLHCLPGSIEEKGQVFTNLKALLNEGGTLFGSTVLGIKDTKSIFTRKIMSIHNRKGIFNNLADTADGFEKELNKNFSSVNIKIIGNIAIFSARN